MEKESNTPIFCNTEVYILERLIDMSLKEIGHDIGISVNTVKFYLKKSYKTLGVHTLVQAHLAFVDYKNKQQSHLENG